MGVGVGRRLDRLDATVRYVLCEFRVKGPGFRVKGPEVRVWSSECMGFMVWGLVFEI